MEDVRAMFRFAIFSIELPLGLGIGDYAVFHGKAAELENAVQFLSVFHCV
jgi:hypothetical protein